MHGIKLSTPSAKRQAPSAKRQAPSAKRQAPSAKKLIFRTFPECIPSNSTWKMSPCWLLRGDCAPNGGEFYRRGGLRWIQGG